MAHRTELLIIDAQNDFCDLPERYCPVDPVSAERLAPALAVPGAHADMLRLAAFVRAHAAALAAITVKLDSHHRVDIAHPPFWRSDTGAPVAPFTTISAAELRAGAYAPRDSAQLARAQAYLDALEASARYRLMVWPVHCQIGSWGHGLHADLAAACNAWEDAKLQAVACVIKGDNPWTEHYSALQAEVPDPADPGTAMNRSLLARLDRADTLLIAGEAGSHCVRASVEHLVEHLPSGRPDRLVLLTDCISPVAGFEAEQAEFLAAMAARGVRLARSTELALR